VNATARAAATIARNPSLRGYARSNSAYSGRFQYGGQRPEMKFLDTEYAAYNIAGNAGSVSTLLTIPQGVGQSERIGRKITVRNARIFP